MKARIYVNRQIVRQAGVSGMINGKPALPLSLRTSKGTTHHSSLAFWGFTITYDPTKCPRVWIETTV